MNPETLAKAGTEHAHQVALFCWAAQSTRKYPELNLMFAVPNGGERNIIVASRLKAEGVKSGVSDIMLPVARCGFSGLFLEMKKPGGKESDNQKAFGASVVKEGYTYACCKNWVDASNLLTRYMENDRISYGLFLETLK
jgi:hypothetical protein